MKTITKLAASVVTVSLLSGCASIITDDQLNVNVTTSNGKAVAYKLDGAMYEAPGVILVSKTGTDRILMSESETCDKQTLLEKKIEPAFWGNILTGGFLGSTTDSVTNKMWTYQKEITINCQG